MNLSDVPGRLAALELLARRLVFVEQSADRLVGLLAASRTRPRCRRSGRGTSAGCRSVVRISRRSASCSPSVPTISATSRRLSSRCSSARVRCRSAPHSGATCWSSCATTSASYSEKLWNQLMAGKWRRCASDVSSMKNAPVLRRHAWVTGSVKSPPGGEIDSSTVSEPIVPSSVSTTPARAKNSAIREPRYVG